MKESAETVTQAPKKRNDYLQRFKTTEQRFWEKVDKNGPVPERFPELGNCWLWNTGSLSIGGYARFKIKGKEYPAHKVAYEFINGKMSNGMLGLHKCDVRHCVNPNHIFPGTQKDNIQDAVKKGRMASGDRHASRLHPGLHAGERNGRAKLTLKQVNEIRELCNQGSLTKRKIASDYGVSPPIISYIANGKIWA